MMTIKMNKLLFVTITSLLAVSHANAQEGFGTNSPAPSSVIDMTATNKGALLPRVALTSIIVAAPVTAPANALTVFNTATAGTAPNNVTPGYYYWSTAGSRWVRVLDQNDAVSLEPWQVQSGTAKASTNAENIYQTGNVAVGDFSGAASTKKMEVKGTFKSEVIDGSISYGTEMNHPVLPAQSILNYRIDNSTGDYKMMAVHPLASVMQAKTSTVESTIAVNDVHSEMSSRLVSGATETAKATIRTESPGNFYMETYNAAPALNYGSTVSLQNDGLRMVHSTTGGSALFLSENSRSEIMVQKGEGIRFDFKDATGNPSGQYWFPITSGAAGQVMTRSGGNKMVWTTPSSFALANNGLTKNATTNEIELGGTLNRSTTITTVNNAVDYPVIFSGNGNSVRITNSGTEGRVLTSGTTRGSVGIAGGNSNIEIYADNNNTGQIVAGGTGNTGLLLRTGATPLRLATDGTERMRISPIGDVGLGTTTPTEKFDNNGITRLRSLPLNGAANAIYTTGTNTASATQNQTFTATRTVVADANGVLGYVVGVPTDAGTSRVMVSAGVPGTQNINGGGNVLANFSVEHIDTNNAWTSNVFTVPASLGGIFIVSMQSSHTHTVDGSSWFTIGRLQKSTDNGGTWQNLLQDTQSNKLGTDVDNGNHLYWTGSLNAGDRVRIIFQCNATASNIVSLGSLTITRLNQ